MRWLGRDRDTPQTEQGEPAETESDAREEAPLVAEEAPVAPKREPDVEPDSQPETESTADEQSAGDVTAGAPILTVESHRNRDARPRRPRPLERGGLVWVLPALVLLLVVTLWPLGRAVYDSLFQSSLVTPDDRSFVGLDGYLSVLGSRTWWTAVGATLGFVAAAVVSQLLLAGVFATALQRVAHGVRWLQAVLLVPFGLLAVVTATTWRDGLTSGFGPQWFGYDGESAAAGVGALLAAEVWRGAGITTLILLAGLARVSPSLREAAVADGANAWQRFWRVTRPAAAPAIAVAVTYRALDALRVLEAPLLAPDATPSTVSLLVWDTTFESFELGLGAVVSVLVLVLAGLLGLLLTKVLRVRRVL